MMNTQPLPPIERPTAEINTRRILLALSYDGTAYAGWQRQENAIAVQQKVEEALTKLTGEQIRITGASRTDAGVHARMQCAHFDTACHIPANKFPFALNTCLPRDIRALSGIAVDSEFHARFDAMGKQYIYRIHNAPHADALFRDFCAHVPTPLDRITMKKSLPALLGTHDFSAFQAAGGTAKTTVRTLSRLDLTWDNDDLVLTVEGNAFLYNMVRIIAGTLIGIGQHRVSENAFARALHSGDRLALGATAPAHGLLLRRIFYPEEIQSALMKNP